MTLTTDAPPPSAPNDISDALKEASGSDSVTLGQLKQIVQSMPKPRPQVYAYHHADSATTREELEEFFSYSGARQICVS
jgi:hypothetical protein